MLKKTITYTDYNGTERTEDFYFNINKAEALQLELGKSGGLTNYLNRIVKEQDAEKLLKIWKEIIDMSYGIKSDDGKRFIKSKEILEDFQQTEAYSELFTEITLDADKATAFVKAIIPQEAKTAAPIAPASVQ